MWRRSCTACGRRPRPAAGRSCSTNGCGGLRPEWPPGTPVLISDHINLTATSPIVGATFVDLTDLYSPRLRALCQDGRPEPRRGRLRAVPRAALRDAGRDRDGARASAATSSACRRRSRRSRPARPGMEVLGISLVTNPAAGMTGEPLDHEEVLEAGKAAAARMGEPARQRRTADLSAIAVRVLVTGGAGRIGSVARLSGSAQRAPTPRPRPVRPAPPFPGEFVVGDCADPAVADAAVGRRRRGGAPRRARPTRRLCRRSCTAMSRPRPPCSTPWSSTASAGWSTRAATTPSA